MTIGTICENIHFIVFYFNFGHFNQNQDKLLHYINDFKLL